MRTWLSAALVLMTVCVPARADDLADAGRVVTETVDAVMAVLRDAALTPVQKSEKIVSKIRPVFDFELMARLTLGKREWTKLSDEQKKEFTDLFVVNLQSSYMDRIEVFSDQKVEFETPVAAKRGKVHAGSYVVSKDERISIKYKLYKTAETWRVYDLEIQDVSIVSSYRSQYRDILQQKTFAELLIMMREKAEARNDE